MRRRFVGLQRGIGVQERPRDRGREIPGSPAWRPKSTVRCHARRCSRLLLALRSNRRTATLLGDVPDTTAAPASDTMVGPAMWAAQAPEASAMGPEVVGDKHNCKGQNDCTGRATARRTSTRARGRTTARAEGAARADGGTRRRFRRRRSNASTIARVSRYAGDSRCSACAARAPSRQIVQIHNTIDF